MSNARPISQLPWQVSRDEFLAAARDVEEGACCMFVIDASIPQSARSGYAALVIAYARADEPVCIFADGSAALLIRSGGLSSAQVVARRILDQMRRLQLDDTLRAGITLVGSDPDAALEASRTVAESGGPGSISVAG